MICSNCQSDNRQEARFCKRCGSWLAPNCPFCAAVLPPASTFCDQCGRQISGQIGNISPVIYSSAPTEVPAAPPPEKLELSPPATVQPVPVKDTRSAGEQVNGSQLHQYISEEMRNKLEAARASGDMVGERRIVTIMFCDVKGSTAAAEHLDPEEWSEIINGVFEHMIKPVYKYEGTVARLMGDGILAFFGAPFAHEDDPQRAVLAGLDILDGIAPYRQQVKDTWGIDINIRVGINTGLVVVGTVGSDLRMEYTALGDAINLASRMEQMASPGTILIARDTYKHVSQLFEFESLGDIEIKGKSEPVPAYRVIQRKDVGVLARGIKGLQVEMVGRETEMQTLRGVMNDLKQGVGRIVCVLGEAGLGKSRLVSETHHLFEDVIGSQGNWWETISLSYEYNQAYGLLQHLIQRVNGMAHDAPPQVVREKLASLVEGFEEQHRPRAMQVFEALFALGNAGNGQPLEDETFRRELFEAIREWMRFQFSDQPTVLVFDDMHWCDAASIDILRKLIPLTEQIPLVILCAMREERSSPAWLIKTTADDEYRHRYSELSLHPLSRAESNELVNRLLAIPEIPDSLRASILEKSDGNPFFIEEVVRTLIDNGAVVSDDRIVDGETKRYWVATNEGADFAIPDNLQSLLAARLDQLEDGTRSTLQMASVIGRSFYHRVLKAVDQDSPELDKHVGDLLRLDMIRESARVPEVEYMFRNPLTQEAVYETILLKHRREFHRRVGDAMEELYPDRLEGLYGLLAHHFALAGQLEKAIEYCRKASRQAVSVYAYEEAVQNLRTALGLIESEDQVDIHLALLEELADVYRLLRDFEQAISYYQQGLNVWSGLAYGDAIVSVRLHRKIVQVATEAKWSVDAETFARVSEISNASQVSLGESLQAMEGKPPHSETVLLLVALSVDAWRNQSPPDWDAAQRFAEAAVDMAKELDDLPLLSRAMGALDNVLDGRSLLRQHLEVAMKRLEISQDPSFEEPHERIDALRGAGVAMMYVGEYKQALPYLREAEELAIDVQATDQIANSLGIQAQCLYRSDRWDEVLAIEEKWRDLEFAHTRERVGET